MAKMPDEIKVIPQEFVVLFAGIALHGQLSSPQQGGSLTNELIVRHSFDIAELMMKEAERRGITIADL